MTPFDMIWTLKLEDIQEITSEDYEYTLCYSQPKVLRYSRTCSAGIVDINEHQLQLFIANILTNTECHFDYVIQDFNHKSGIATMFYKNNYIYYTLYDDVFSNPFDVVKLKVDTIILERLRKISAGV